MDLILWRHAEAFDPEPGQNDLERVLTPRGQKHASRMADWLERQLPEGARILSSPAVRAEQTVRALSRKYKVRDALSPGASVEDLLEAAGWPDAKHAVVLVGHQPSLGLLASRLLQMGDGACPIRKGAVWWLRNRHREGQDQTVIMSVTVPDRL
ncbi:SixA phosphatase family protein [Limnohabitans planktonicus]|uniref:Histidine phosphatase family protein n=1 Tax=Limnohabitans planktonicus II-D5 TaxID=1293045 RepID=A0A2T7UBQ1_9BURK|nr:histidine phosphatase family protein [Limnohabitans planktonicus]PVE42103.1 histidine phosphatase family protein [Limnohabitans planktonicus II-D5]|eukprot:gene23005-29193_t